MSAIDILLTIIAASVLTIVLIFFLAWRNDGANDRNWKDRD